MLAHFVSLQSCNCSPLLSIQKTMLTWDEFVDSSFQFVAFRRMPELFDAGRFARVLIKDFGDVFNGELQVLPLTADAPAEIPRVFVQSEDRQWALNVSLTSMVCVWTPSEQTRSAPHNKGSDILSSLAKGTSFRTNRLALVIRRLLRKEEAARELIAHFCTPERQQEPLNRSNAFEIHNHKVYEPSYESDRFKVNSWVRCSTSAGSSPCISILQDINTLAPDDNSAPETDKYYGPPAFDSFFRMAQSEADVILKKYFPTPRTSPHALS